jgi:hypothetical protein
METEACLKTTMRDYRLFGEYMASRVVKIGMHSQECKQ